jgi:cAMP-binding proteins - catabolite gene activator and regulatory subunit of cAMP-dependent protein kinases
MSLNIRALLRQIALFKDLTEDEMNQLASIALRRSFGKKEIIFTEGTEVEAIYFVSSGLVKTFKTDEDGRERLVSILREGEMFPHTVLFSGQPYPASAETIAPSVLIALPARPFEHFLEQHAAPTIRIIRDMSDKIVELQRRLQEAGAYDAHDRGLRFLADLADHCGERRGGAIHIRMPLTHQDIASAIGTSRETVSRLLNQLKRDGILEAGRSGIVIRDPEALRREIGDG